MQPSDLINLSSRAPASFIGQEMPEGELSGRSVTQINSAFIFPLGLCLPSESGSDEGWPFGVKKQEIATPPATLPKTLVKQVLACKNRQACVFSFVLMRVRCDFSAIEGLLPEAKNRDFTRFLTALLYVSEMAYSAEEKIRSNTVDASLNDGDLRDSMEFIRYYAPHLAQALRDQWMVKKEQFVLSAEKLPATKKNRVHEKLKSLEESLLLLVDCCTKPEPIFHTVLSEIGPLENDGSDHTPKDCLHWMLEIYKYMAHSFKQDEKFWGTVEYACVGMKGDCYRADLEIVYEKLKNIIQFLERTIKNDKRSLATLLQFQDSLTLHAKVIGNFHTMAMRQSKDEDLKKKAIGLVFDEPFYSYLTKVVPDKKAVIFLKTFNASIAHFFVRTHDDMTVFAESYLFSAIAKQMKIENLKPCPQKIADFLSQSNFVITSLKKLFVLPESYTVFNNGNGALSFLKLIEDTEKLVGKVYKLRESNNPPLDVILSCVKDVELVISNLLRNGMVIKIDILKRSIQVSKSHYLNIEQADHAKRQELVGKIEKIAEEIEMLIEISGLIEENSAALKALKKDIFNGTASPARPFEMCPAAAARAVKKVGKNERRKQIKAAQQKETASPVVDLTPTAAAQPVTDVVLASEDEFMACADDLIEKTELLQNYVNESQSIKEDDGIGSVRNIRPRELCEQLKQAGWKFLRCTGSHFQYVHPNRPEVGRAVVPFHSDRPVSIGVANKVKGQIQESIRKK